MDGSMTIFTKLENGLTVHLKEIHTSPIISHWVWYRVGSRDEHPGKRGLSHWVEHMQFKGSEQFPNGVLDRMISRDGGLWNAFTNLDWTAYFQVMPASKIEIALALEADRMQNSLFDPKEVESERTVILSELEGNENEPLFRLNTALNRSAFDRHPYRYEVIGTREDLLSITREDLYSHYRKYYTPGNAVVCVAGDFDSQEMLAKLEHTYAGIPPGEEISPPDLKESVPNQERQVEVKGAGTTTYLQLSYRSPAGAQEDFFALNVLDSLLTGPSGLNMFGGGSISNRTSRLYRDLVEGDKAVAVRGSLQATIDPYLYNILVIVHPNQQPEDVLKAVDQQIEQIRNDQVTTAEIERAIKQAKALFAYGTESVTNQAFWLGYTEMFASYDWFENYIQSLEKTTPAILLETAQRYLDPTRRVVGIYRPGDMGAVQ
jgi:zinc protease